MTNKVNSAESIRGLASIAVVLSHTSLVFFPQLHNFSQSDIVPKYDFLEFIHNSPFAFFYSGTGAVFVFFVLSGYVLSLSTLKTDNVSKKLKTSLIKRYPRLAIPTLFSCLVAYLTWYLTIDVSHIAEWGAALGGNKPYLYAAFFEGLVSSFLFGASAYNWVLWTMQIELLGSLLIYFACFFYKKQKRVLIPFLAACLFGAYNISEPVFMGMLSFLLGMGIFLYAREISNKVAILLFVIGLYFCGAHNTSASYKIFTDLMDDATYDRLNFLGGFLIVYSVLKSELLARLGDTKFLVFLGKVSFSVYLIHLAVTYALGIPFFNFVYLKLHFSFLSSGLLATLFILVASTVLAIPCSNYVDDFAVKFSNMLVAKLN